MKKILSILMIILAFSMILTACTSQSGDKNQSVGNSEEHVGSLTYSNLVDSASQDEVRKAMELAGISVEDIDAFFQNVNDFNDIIGQKDLVKEGFVTVDNLNPEYDVVVIGDMWNKKSPTFIGHNCRLTTFGLMKDLISIANVDTKGSEENLFMDMDAIENSPKEIFNQLELEEFKTIFSIVPTDSTKDINVHLNNVKENWADRGIEFSKNSNASLISVFFHFDDEGYVFIGHAGILLPSEDGRLLFVEKLSFQEPYQAIKFNNRVELNDYLMNKYDISWGQPDAKPFIMENDELLEGYRENQNNKEVVD